MGMLRKAMVLVLMGLFLVPAGMAAASSEQPAFQVFHSIVEAPFVKEVVDGDQLGVVIDSRPKRKKYNEGHIPGALSIPDTQFDKLKGLLPADKDALVVFYCGGLKCPLSHKSAFKAEALGYKNVKVFALGYPEWEKTYGPGVEGVQTAEAKKPVAAGTKFKAGKNEGSIAFADFEQVVKKRPESILLVDNREPAEFKAGTFPTALNIPVDQLEKKLVAWNVDKPVIYFCGTGARSGEAFYMTRDKRPELKEVYYLDAEVTFDGNGSFKLTQPK